MDTLKEFILKSIESQKRFIGYAFDAMNFDYEKAFTEFANSIGKNGYNELTKEEKQQAVLNAVLREHDD